MHALTRLVLVAALGWSALPAAEAQLTVTCNGQRRQVSAADLAKLPAIDVAALDHGQSHHYHGVAVRDLLTQAGAPLGEKLRGRALALVVRVRAADAYVAVFSLAEFDPAFREQTIILADAQDGAPLSAEAGPLRLVCPGDKRPARWVRQVISIEVVPLAEGQPPKS
jgi:hypothetical protein